MDHFFDSVIEKLPKAFQLLYPETFLKNITSIRGIITTPWTKVNAELINSLPNLEIISCFGTGIDSVDKNAALSKKIHLFIIMTI